VALHGRFISSPPTEDEQALAIDAARAIGAELVGVDLLPDPEHGSVVLEVNGAVDFSEDEESLAGRSIYADTPRRSRSVGRNRSPPESDGAIGGRGWMQGVDGPRSFVGTSRLSPG
jgi:RimK-like ATP-grasp domain